MKNWRRMVIVAFWVFVAVMLARQAYNYNSQVELESKNHPEQHYFYNPGAAAQTAPKTPTPDVRQVAYKVIHDLPEPGNFTIEFTVKNVGNAAATAIQVNVRPYRGIVLADQDNGHVVHGATPGSGPTGGAVPLSENDPISKFGQVVAIPDLAPGQSSSQSVVFVDQPSESPNEDDPQLEISFEPMKAK